MCVCVCVCVSDRGFPLWQSGRQKFVKKFVIVCMCVCVCVLLTGDFPCGSLVNTSFYMYIMQTLIHLSFFFLLQDNVRHVSAGKKARRKRYRKKKKLIHCVGREAWEDLSVDRMKKRWQDVSKKFDDARTTEREERKKKEERKRVRCVQRAQQKARVECRQNCNDEPH